jgi:hypothetical protein
LLRQGKETTMTQQPWHPGTLLETSGYFWKTCTLHAAVKLDVFTVIGEKRLGAEEIATQAGADPDAAERLLSALAGMELLVKENGPVCQYRSRGNVFVQILPPLYRLHDPPPPLSG